MKRSIYYSFICCAVLLFACTDTEHSKQQLEKVTVSDKSKNTNKLLQDKNHPVSFSEAMSQHAQKADDYFNQSIEAFGIGNFNKSSVLLDNAVYELALEASYLSASGHERFDGSIKYLNKLAMLISDHKIKDIKKIKYGITHARLSLALEMLTAIPDVEIVTEQTKKQISSTNKNETTNKLLDTMPHLALMITELQVAAHHLEGQKRMEIENIMHRAKQIAAQNFENTESSQNALSQIYDDMQAFLMSHKKEMHEMNVEIQDKIDSNSKEQEENMHEMRKEIRAEVVKEKKFIKEQLTEKKEIKKN